MKFNENNSKTVISTAVTLTDKKSPNINKTADQCNLNELINEMFLQLKEAYPNLPKPTYSIISPGIIYNNQNKKWESIDTDTSTLLNVIYSLRIVIYFFINTAEQ
jgi:hypothetical protein